MQKIISAIRRFGAFAAQILLRDRGKFWLIVTNRQNLTEEATAQRAKKKPEVGRLRALRITCEAREMLTALTLLGLSDCTSENQAGTSCQPTNALFSSENTAAARTNSFEDVAP